jgi:hypothetical protein
VVSTSSVDVGIAGLTLYSDFVTPSEYVESILFSHVYAGVSLLWYEV